ncbi:helix-turn-helix domain-containing protein [Bacillus haynesii]|uniref:helix-turn-helix transcriptional regulator n=1 Tax=Bacillus haynesii TaxID=1925021 RepID=UPI0022832C6D|nr:helix-turn-helix transcriptional regulator [Bacillus haynesii]MCY8009737.1 helix-turn-helix domain-containing protein [Bacillus haynesii]MCY8567437.1 helix-turn-helix domain-containing protein [Bacillus haynesii]
MKNTNLISARKEKGYTQDELALILHCQKTTISNWENGVSHPTLPIAFKLSEVLGRDINDLFLNLKVQDTQTNTA